LRLLVIHTEEIVWIVFWTDCLLYCSKRLIDWHSSAACNNNKNYMGFVSFFCNLGAVH
jgi:hypothetical protein